MSRPVNPPSLVRLLLDRLVILVCLIAGVLLGVYVVGPPLSRAFGVW